MIEFGEASGGGGGGGGGNAGSTLAHRYWRLFFLSVGNNGAPYCAIAEITMAETVGGLNILTGGVASAMNNFGADYTPDKAVDGDPATFWDGTSVPTWWSYDLGAGVTKKVSQLTILSRNDRQTEQTPVAGFVQYSDDGSHWFNAWDWGTSDTIGLGQLETYTRG